MLVLASASPRRQELLRNAGISFVVQPADVDESALAGESARECAERLAREKALKVWRERPGDQVLGADTIVVVDGRLLGKPVDAADAARMLRMLSGRVHEVITGVCLVAGVAGGQWSGGRETRPRGQFHDSGAEIRGRETKNCEIRIASETTLVTMTAISESEIKTYVATGEPMDKAGAYAIQGMASRWIPRIEGDYSNVVGLPVALVYRMLRGTPVE
ncbi:MAG TPA: Maf family protein [Candidatus Sulfotelmatobacter sp.]|nr:Maf family protein [Candidatus Sulfotelmatobacter sp.]